MPPSSADRLVPNTSVGLEPDGLFQRSFRPGGGLLAWNRGTTDLREASIVAVSARGRIGAEHRLPRPVDALARGAAGGVALLSGQEVDRNTNAHKSPGLWAVSVTHDGTPGGLQQLTNADTYGARLAINARGDAVVAWLDWPGLRLRVATRRAGRSFSAPVELARANPEFPTLGDVAISVSERGRVLIAYGSSVRGANDQALAWVGAVGGRFGALQRLGRMTVTNSEEEPGAAISAAFDGRGRGYVAWGGPKRQSPVSYASVAPVGTTFTRAVTVDTGSRRNGIDFFGQGAHLVGAQSGGAALAWTSPDGDARLTMIDAAGRRGRTERYRGAVVTQLVAGPSALIALATASARGAESRVRTARRGSPTTLLDALPPELADGAAWSFDAGGRVQGMRVALGDAGQPELRIATWRASTGRFPSR